MKTKITMNSSKNLSVESAYELFIRKCRVKNLSEATITSYNNKVIPFVEFCNGGDISAVTVDTVDAFTDMIANLKALQEMGAISKETIMEKSDIVSDVEVEKSRLGAEYIEDDVVE